MPAPLFALVYVGGFFAFLVWLIAGRHVTGRGVATVATAWMAAVITIAHFTH